MHSLSLSQPVELEILEVLTSVAKEYGVSRWLANAEENVRAMGLREALAEASAIITTDH